MKRRTVMNLYVSQNPFKWSAFFYAVSAILFGLFAFFDRAPWRIVGTSVLAAGFLVQTTGIGVRLFLTGHVPVSNMYESIIFTVWVALGLGVGSELYKRNGVIGLGAAVIGFLSLVGVSLMPLYDTRLHPLRAVLNSYWLNIHVTMMLCSYAASS